MRKPTAFWSSQNIRMITEARRITVGGIAVEVVRKDIKNLHLGVYPPDGRVRVAAPLAVKDEAVRLAVIGKLGWIKRQRARFASQPRQSRREMVAGESHYFMGRRYRLRVHEHNGAPRVAIRGSSSLDLFVRAGADAGQRESALLKWHREQLRLVAQPLLEKWQAALGVRVAEFGIKRMKTKWGSCNRSAGRIWLNLELAKKPMRCIEYIVVHEMLHLRHRRHDGEFVAMLDHHLPAWRRTRAELNRAPLAHENWQQ